MSDEKLPEKDKEITAGDPQEETTPSQEVQEEKTVDNPETPKVEESAVTEEEVTPVAETEETASPEAEETDSQEETSKEDTTAEGEEETPEETPAEAESGDKPKETAVEKPAVDYSSMSQEELLVAFAALLKEGQIGQIKSDVDEIRSAFNQKFQAELDEETKLGLSQVNLEEALSRVNELVIEDKAKRRPSTGSECRTEFETRDDFQELLTCCLERSTA